MQQNIGFLHFLPKLLVITFFYVNKFIVVDKKVQKNETFRILNLKSFFVKYYYQFFVFREKIQILERKMF